MAVAAISILATGRFSDNAFKYVESISPKVILIDRKTLPTLMIDHGLGTSITARG